MLVFTISIFPISNLFAVRATPHPVTITQADGTKITFRLQGDEHFHYKTTIDGYALISDSKDILTYAQPNEKGNLISTNIKASDINKRSAKEKQFLKTLTKNITLSRVSQLNVLCVHRQQRLPPLLKKHFH